MNKFLGVLFILLITAALIFTFFKGTKWLKSINFILPNESFIKNLSSYPPKKEVKKSPVGGFSTTEVEKIEKKELVRISFVRPMNSFRSYTELSLYANLNKDEKVNISGWTIKTNKDSFKIPQAQDIYDSAGAEEDIILRSGEKVLMYSLPKLRGNFRLNKCIGYIEDAAPLTPSLSQSCPEISRSEIASLSGLCQNYIRSLSSCENPSANPPVPFNDSACHDFLSKLNYAGCVAKYKNDAGFRLKEWRLWLGPSMNIFDGFHDKVQIFDGNGSLISEYVY